MGQGRSLRRRAGRLADAGALPRQAVLALDDGVLEAGLVVALGAADDLGVLGAAHGGGVHRVGLLPPHSPMRMVKSWMTGFVSSRRHILSTSAFAFALSFVLSWMSHVFVVCTPVTPSKPRRCSALAV